jgi:hypothetical protein
MSKELEWFKSSFSNGQAECVEIAFLSDGAVYIRDSKLGDDSPVLNFTASEWSAFVKGAEGGEFTRP